MYAAAKLEVISKLKSLKSNKVTSGTGSFGKFSLFRCRYLNTLKVFST